MINRLKRKIIKILAPQVFKMNKRIMLGKNFLVNDWPEIKVPKGTKLIVGDRVTLNSSNTGYHINMHSPMKIYLSHKGARIRIGNNSRIHGTCLHAYSSIEIGENCLIASNCQIFDCSRHSLSFANPVERLIPTIKSKPISIEDNVWIGANCIILPGVKIGEGSVVGAGSVVNSDIPPYSLAMGNPANIIKNDSKIKNK